MMFDVCFMLGYYNNKACRNFCEEYIIPFAEFEEDGFDLLPFFSTPFKKLPEFAQKSSSCIFCAYRLDAYAIKADVSVLAVSQNHELCTSCLEVFIHGSIMREAFKNYDILDVLAILPKSKNCKACEKKAGKQGGTLQAASKKFKECESCMNEIN